MKAMFIFLLMLLEIKKASSQRLPLWGMNFRREQANSGLEVFPEKRKLALPSSSARFITDDCALVCGQYVTCMMFSTLPQERACVMFSTSFAAEDKVLPGDGYKESFDSNLNYYRYVYV